MLLSEYIYPNAMNMDGDKFRKYYCYNVGTDTILKKNEVPIKKLFESF